MSIFPISPSAVILPPSPPLSDLSSLLARLSFTPDPLQLQILSSPHPRLILNCCRQFGKSTITSIKAVHHALNQPRATVLIAAPSEKQSAELVDKCAAHLSTLQVPFKNDRRHRAGLLLSDNGARILALPNTTSTTRGYSASFLIIDEAARVSDDVYTALRPTLAAAADDAPLWLLSTPAAPTGFFHRFCCNAGFSLDRNAGFSLHSALPSDSHSGFQYFRYTIHDCPRISPSTIEQLRRELSPDQFARECLAEFSASQSSVFALAELDLALDPAITPFDFSSQSPSFLGAPATHRFDYILGLDFGKSHDHSALALLEFRITPTSHRDGVTFAPLGQVHLRLRHLDQLPLHTDYSTVLTHLAQLLAHPALARRTALVFDANGVGAGLYEQLRDARLPAQLVPVTYTAGLKTTQSNSVYHVPKSTLITYLQTAFRQRHLAIAPALPHLDSLTQELALFERTLTASGHALYEPSKSSAHDDLLNALALANWFVHHNYQSRFRHAASGQLFLSLPNLGPF